MNVIRAARTSISKIRLRRKKSSASDKVHPEMEGTKTMKELGYVFNSNGQVRKLGPDGQPTEEPFQFVVSTDHQECQAHYEELGSAITKYVYDVLENQIGLQKLPIPKDSFDGTFIFASKDYEKKDVLLILIHGSGVVRAGQWARSLIINESLDKGTQIPYIKKALAKDYGLIIMNTNDNCTADGKTILNSSTAEEHALYTWLNYVSPANATSVLIVAHSYGGVVTVSLAEEVKNDFEERVKAVAFTDSVHSYSNKKITPFLKQVAINWISSQAPLDTPLRTPDFDITRLSAGHEKHEMTSHMCIESVFKYFEESLKKN